MDVITKEILSWNYNLKEWKEDFYKNKNLPDFFISSLEYKKRFEPLFFEEFRAQIKRYLEIESASSEEVICKVNFFQKKGGRFFFSAELDETLHIYIKKGDLLILSGDKNNGKNPKDQLKDFGVVSYNTLKQKPEIKIETNLNFWKKILEAKIESGKISIQKVSNLMNHVREYMALFNFFHSPPIYKRLIFPVFIIEKNPKGQKRNILLKNHLEKHFNKSQILGIFATSKDGIILVQGPPGTGKTRTVLGILSLIFGRFKNHFKMQEKEFRSDRKLSIAPEFLSNHPRKKLPRLNFSLLPNTGSNYFFHNSKKTQKIVICAPSNAAIDENTTRTGLGLPSQSIRMISKPFKILRLGPNYSSSLDHLSLENLALLWASENDLNIRLRIHSKIFQKARIEIIKKCFIIYTTLACTGYPIVKQIFNEETIIIDEAAQAVELSTLIPLKKRSKKIILVGDVQQLPATVFSKSSIDLEYDRSLFKRLQLRKHPVWFLETQYRMHPQISSFPARKFYQNGLKDSQRAGKTIKFHSLRCFGPLNFFDLCESSEQNHLKQFSAWCNLDEVRLVSLFLRALLCLNPSFNSYSTGIITGYNGQIKEFHDYQYNRKPKFEGQINTVDGFQGKEKDIIFLSCVRARIEMGIGFLSDCRRINVAFTRARHGFWIMGNSETLEKDSSWKEAIVDLKKRKRFFCIRKPLERSSRRLVYWAIKDSKPFSLDGNLLEPISIRLLNYLSQ